MKYLLIAILAAAAAVPGCAMDQPECDKLAKDVQTYFSNLDGPKYSVHVFPTWMAKFGTCLMFEGVYQDGKMVRAEIYGVPGWLNYGDYDPSSANLLNDKCHVLNTPCTDADSFLNLWSRLSDPNSYGTVRDHHCAVGYTHSTASIVFSGTGKAYPLSAFGDNGSPIAAECGCPAAGTAEHAADLPA